MNRYDRNGDEHMDFTQFYILYRTNSTSNAWTLYKTPFLSLAEARQTAYKMLGSNPGSGGNLGPDDIKIVQELPKGF